VTPSQEHQGTNQTTLRTIQGISENKPGNTKVQTGQRRGQNRETVKASQETPRNKPDNTEYKTRKDDTRDKTRKQ
jgi:hypothetical protein